MKREDFDIRHARICKCGNTYFKFSTLQNKCVKCLAEKGKEIVAKETRKAYRARKEKLKTRGEHIAEAQKEFNAYIRERDRNLSCISCGRFHQGQWHAGHYRTTAAAPELRFHEDNVHKQCAPCNHDLSGNIVEYRKGLAEKIGEEKVAWLEGKHEQKKYTFEELKDLKKTYREKTRALKRG